jgi:chromosome segregation protein
MDEIAQRDAREQARSAELAAAVEQQEGQLRTAEQREAEAQDQLILAEEQGHAGQLRWDEFIQRAEGPLSQVEAERVRVQQLERQVRAGDERLTRLRAEQAGLDASPIQATLQDADAELQVLQRDLADGRAQLQNLDREIQELRDARAAADGALHEARQALQGARGRLSSLETLQAAALRQDDAELNAWLRERGLDGSRRFASALQVESGWEAAVEHVLDHLLQAPLVADLQDKIGGLGQAPKSGVALIQDAGSATDSAADQLSAKASGPAALIGFLQGIFVVETLDEARQRAASLRAGESVITREGIWFGREWVRYPRTDKDRSGVLARGALLKQLRVEVEAQAETVRAREQTLDELRNRTQVLEGQRRDLSNRFDQIRGREAQRMAFRQAQAVRLEQTEARVRQLAQEVTALSVGHAQQSDELTASRESLVQLEEIARQLREERTSLQQELARLREAAQRARQAAQQAAVARGQAQLQLAARRSALDALRQGLQDLLARRESLLQNKTRQEAELAALNEPLQLRAQEAGAAAAVVREAREALRQARERLTAVEVRQGEAAHRVQEAQFEQDASRERLQQAQIDSQGMMVRRQTLAEQIVETGYDRGVLLESLKEEITPEAWDEKLASMARRIERLGPINLAAIQELDEAQARETELGRQHEDISSALAVLEEAIAMIDHETQERFKQTFDRVNEIFKDRFPKLFGGGEAYLELTDANLLETGVRVMARPPGKRNSSIQLLSGGEKAMTAVALLLALFQLNPAPFCLMDEVDAPLDDANVGRFCEVVREMALTVQFIIITHNKITMELANQLHGVTMQEPGVSRLVSVSVQEAVKLTETGEVKELA